jgi:hypothetical protein
MQVSVMDRGRFDAPHGIPGDAELQTDVMRFFALLAICLIALMSLVTETPPPIELIEEPPPRAPRVAARPAPKRVSAETPVHASPPPAPSPAPPKRVAAETSPAVERAPAKPVEPAPSAERVAAETPPAPAGRLELRFASPEALMRLSARNEVQIFALADGTGYRWSRAAGRFASHRLPDELYLLEPATVPASLRSALAASASEPRDITWGVTLSSSIRARLDRRLADGARGLLLIDAAGNVAPEAELP